ncbi:MAG: tetratricopeptide repeat protein [Flavobacteriaceae bacterium]|nr:tetratricopeptide repeat protein [Flavobacteriaceae bacterium]
MKNLIFSFLFFFISFLGLVVVSDSLYAQEKTDSENYYYSVIIHGENVSKVNLAFEYHKSLYEMDLNKGDFISASYDLEIIANGRHQFGDYRESEDRLVDALSLIDSMDDSIANKAKKRILNLLGILYRDRSAYDEAHKLYKRSFELADKTADSISVINNIANLLRDQDRSKQAIDTLNFAYELALGFGNVKLIAYTVDNLGFAQSLIYHQDALSNINKGLALRLEIDDSLGLFSSYRHLANFYKNRNLNGEALLYAEKTLSASYLHKDVTYEKKALGLLMELGSDPNSRRFKFLNDSIETVNQKRAYSYASMKFNVEKERERTFVSELKREEDRSKRVISQAAVIVILVIAVFLFSMVRNRHKKEKVREVFLTESRISKKVHDEVANNVYQVMTKLQSNSSTSEELLDDLDGIYTKTRDISKEHSLVDVQINFGQQLEDLFRSYETSEISVVTQNNAKILWNEVSELKKKIIYKVLQELLVNMRKHSGASHALISFSQKKSKVSIQYNDNGIGCNLKKSNGLQNVETRIAALNGRVTFESEPNKGFRAKMEV